MAATAFSNVTTTILVLNLLISTNPTAATWCVAKTDAAADALQKALDYACGAGADCEPLQEAGLCFTPNTVEAHASYAFNSYYMHSSMDPVACNFAGTATIVKTDPSYGSCVYPASPSTAGGTKNPPSDTAVPPPQNGAPLPMDGSGGELQPPPGDATPLGSGGAVTPTGMASATDNSPSGAFTRSPVSLLLIMGMTFMVFFIMFEPMGIFVV
ncbi:PLASMODESMATA CALLOSE-BINDING PROTEIN 2-like [Bidens hawaiensis]|uniref:PLASMODESMATA CALLOSE-BINDING PROTEIN 2-like n=1 Tax=Bidens hawaiensis TaxID=980011 RepID=UPI00404B843E